MRKIIGELKNKTFLLFNGKNTKKIRQIAVNPSKIRSKYIDKVIFSAKLYISYCKMQSINRIKPANRPFADIFINLLIVISLSSCSFQQNINIIRAIIIFHAILNICKLMTCRIALRYM